MPDSARVGGDKQLRWRSKQTTAPLSRVPSAPGLYAYGHDQRDFLGLRADRTYVYIGQTDNLRRRLEQHLPRNDANKRLADYLRRYSSVARCWYCPLEGVSARARRKLEEELIRFYEPEFNTQNKP